MKKLKQNPESISEQLVKLNGKKVVVIGGDENYYGILCGPKTLIPGWTVYLVKNDIAIRQGHDPKISAENSLSLNSKNIERIDGRRIYLKSQIRKNPKLKRNSKIQNPAELIDQLVNLIGKRVCIRGDGDDKFGTLTHWYDLPVSLKFFIEMENKAVYSSREKLKSSKHDYTVSDIFGNIIYQFSYIFIKKIDGRIIWMDMTVISKFNEIFKNDA